jgi:phospholipase C
LSGQSGGLKVNEPVPGGYDWTSIFHVLEDHGIPWGYYWQDVPFAPLFSGINIERVREFSISFFDHARNGTLPQVTFVEPNFQMNDDHPPRHPMMGQAFLASIYAALADSPLWKKLLFVITYDEHGGYFDHVSPPKTKDDRAAAGFDQLGFRVPTLVAGPYVKKGHVSSTVRDHSSVIAHICRMFNLPHLTARDAAANDLFDLLDTDRLAAGRPRKPAVLPAIEVDADSLPRFCFGGNEDLHRMVDTGVLERRWDRRDKMMDDVCAIGEALDRLNAGRLIKG